MSRLTPRQVEGLGGTGGVVGARPSQDGLAAI
jgi:hypothetical protein